MGLVKGSGQNTPAITWANVGGPAPRAPTRPALKSGVPTGIRTPVASVKGMCPRPLDDGDAGLKKSIVRRHQIWWSQAGSNRRPLACHASALPAELWPHMEARDVTGWGPIRQEIERATRSKRRAPWPTAPAPRFSPEWPRWRRWAAIRSRRRLPGESAAPICRARGLWRSRSR